MHALHDGHYVIPQTRCGGRGATPSPRGSTHRDGPRTPQDSRKKSTKSHTMMAPAPVAGFVDINRRSTNLQKNMHPKRTMKMTTSMKS